LHGKAYYQLHRERISQNSTTYRQTHKEQVKQRSQRQNRLYREKYPERRRVYEHNREARKRAIEGTHTAAQIAEQLKRQHYKCYYAKCGFAKFKKVKGKYVYHVEHTYPLSRVVGMDIPANDMSYLVLSCSHCNESKGSKFPWEWIEGGRLM
jgi:hypothetical protein